MQVLCTYVLHFSHSILILSNWGTESDPDFSGYHNGNSDPKGFGELPQVVVTAVLCCVLSQIHHFSLHEGHIGISVPDVYKACERFEKLGVNFIKKPDGGWSDETPKYYTIGWTHASLCVT